MEIDRFSLIGVLSPYVKHRFYVKYDSCDTPLPPESVCGIHVLYEGNRIEVLLA